MRFIPLLRCGAVLLSLSSLCSAQTYQWTAFAGLPPQYGSADGNGASARFYVPAGIATDAAGNAYVADSWNATIRRIAADGTVTTLAGAPGRYGSADGAGPAARFDIPTDLVVANGSLFVTERFNHTIRRVTGTGVVTTFTGRAGAAGSADGPLALARFNFPCGITTDSAGNLYVADRGNHTIRKIGNDGVVSTLAGQPGVAGFADDRGQAARFRNPGFVSIGNGALYVSDSGNHVIRKVGFDGTVTTVAGAAGIPGAANGTATAARFRTPEGILAGPDGTLIVADTGNSCLRVVSPAGSVTLLSGRLNVEGFQDGGLTVARYFGPIGLAIAADGGLLVADTLNHSIRRLAPAADAVTTLAGGGGNFGKVDGRGAAARFNYPTGVAVHSSGDVYLADTRGNTIRRISPTGDVVRIAGNGTTDYVDGSAAVASVNYPMGIAVTEDRHVYFCEQQLHTVRLLKPDGSIETIAGTQGASGSADGSGTAARFSFPSAVARDADGNVFIADSSNHTIRRIAAGSNTVTTFAGSAGARGAVDGMGVSARFDIPEGLCTDANGNLYVADRGNHVIRRISRSGEVTTIAGKPGERGATDGNLATARFSEPRGIAIDGRGRIYVGEMGNMTIRMIDGQTVSTIGGRAGTFGWQDGNTESSLFFRPNSIAVDAAGNLFVSDSGNNLVEKGTPAAAPFITSGPQSQVLAAGSTATFTVNASGAGLSYQWKFNGTAMPGATGSSYTVANVQASNTGTYSVDVTAAGGTSTATATLAIGTPSNAGRLINLSVLTSLDGRGEFTLGFVVGGAGTAGSKPVVLRAAGPSLTALGVGGALDDPKIEIYASGAKAGENDDWGGSSALRDAMAAVGAFAFSSVTSRDAALAMTTAARDNSIKVVAPGSAGGTVLAEIYDATPPAAFTSSTPRLVNVSVLKPIGTSLTAGFVIGGGTARNVLIRAIGPTLGQAPFNVGGVLADPQIALFAADGSRLQQNNDWGGGAELSAAFSAVGAFVLRGDSKDAALTALVSPGNYTVVVSAAAGESGIALVEIYEVP